MPSICRVCTLIHSIPKDGPYADLTAPPRDPREDRLPECNVVYLPMTRFQESDSRQSHLGIEAIRPRVILRGDKWGNCTKMLGAPKRPLNKNDMGIILTSIIQEELASAT